MKLDGSWEGSWTKVLAPLLVVEGVAFGSTMWIAEVDEDMQWVR